MKIIEYANGYRIYIGKLSKGKLSFVIKNEYIAISTGRVKMIEFNNDYFRDCASYPDHIILKKLLDDEYINKEEYLQLLLMVK